LLQGGTDTSQGKVNLLVQAYISKRHMEDFALVSDTMYAAQNAGRIVRALLEMALSRKWAGASAVLMSMSKSIEKQIWGYEHPITQFGLSADVLYNLGRWADDLDIWELAAKSASELGTLIHLNERHGAALQKAAKQFPTLSISHRVRPLSHDLLKISLHIERAFEWAQKVHGTVEPFWIWVEDEQGINILQLARTVFGPSTTHLSLDFIIPIPDGRLPASVQIRAISDKWIGAEDGCTVPFHDLSMPVQSHWHTSLLSLAFLPITVLKFHRAEQAYERRFRQFNSIQTQAFWSIYNTDRNVLIAGPVSSGKSILGQLAIW
jgi:antiviral helicase SLH1